jgi:hypothetical protein
MEQPRNITTHSIGAIFGEKLETDPQLVGLHTISMKIHAWRKYFFKRVILIAPSSHAAQTFRLLQTRVPDCDMAKIEVCVGDRNRIGLGCDTCRCASRAFLSQF